MPSKKSTTRASSSSDDASSCLRKWATRGVIAFVVYLVCSFLDRTNVGNARLYNLEEDLGMTNHQYNQGLAVFYATYIARYAHSLRDLPPCEEEND